jgi:hypothetical protein
LSPEQQLILSEVNHLINARLLYTVARADLWFWVMQKTNPRRRVLLIAIASWAIVGLRAKSANPFTGAIGLARMGRNALGGAAKVAIPFAKTPLKMVFFIIRGILRLAIKKRRAK